MGLRLVKKQPELSCNFALRVENSNGEDRSPEWPRSDDFSSGYRRPTPVSLYISIFFGEVMRTRVRSHKVGKRLAGVVVFNSHERQGGERRVRILVDFAEGQNEVRDED